MARCSKDGELPAVGYFALNDGSPVPSLHGLLAELKKGIARQLHDELRRPLLDQFLCVTPDVRMQREQRRRGSQCRARFVPDGGGPTTFWSMRAYVELAQAANRDLFDDSLPNSRLLRAGISASQKRHKVPVCGKQCETRRCRPASFPLPDDPIYLRLRGDPRETCWFVDSFDSFEVADRCGRSLPPSRCHHLAKPSDERLAQPLHFGCFGERE